MPITPAHARREATAFVVLSIGAALAIALAMPHSQLNLFLCAFVPATVVTAIIAFASPRGTRRDAWRAVGLVRLGSGSWVPALLVPVGLLLGAYGIAIAVGAGHLRPLEFDRAGAFTLNLIAALVLLPFIILGEEIGWRGYLLPRLQLLTTPGRAARLTGFFVSGLAFWLLRRPGGARRLAVAIA